MRRLSFSLLIMAFVSGAFFSSCNKKSMNNRMHHKSGNQDEPTQYITINKTISYGELYTFDLSQYEDADDLSAITQQATKFSISELSGSASTKNNIYTYSLNTMNKNFVGQTSTSNHPTANGSESADANPLLAESQQQQIIITVTEGEHDQAPHQGGCMNGGSEHQSNVGEVEAVITINLTIQ